MIEAGLRFRERSQFASRVGVILVKPRSGGYEVYNPGSRLGLKEVPPLLHPSERKTGARRGPVFNL